MKNITVIIIALITVKIFAATPDSKTIREQINNNKDSKNLTHMKFEITAFPDGGTIPRKYAFCIPSKKEHVQLGKDNNPELHWSNIPAGTKSLAIIAVDTDAPSVENNVNKEGIMIPKNLPRVNFYHWVLFDIPPSIHEIRAGQDSDGITAHGKPPGPTAYGVRGINDYTKWFVLDKNMTGEYGGYDGPCPPWNDELLHHFHFYLYALDVKTLKINGSLDGAAVIAAMQGHIIMKSEWIGTYSLNPNIYN